MIKSNQMLPNEHDFKTNKSAFTDISANDNEPGLMPPNQGATLAANRDN